jgi:hypothetical protein
MVERTQPLATSSAGAQGGGSLAAYLERTELAALIRAFGTLPEIVRTGIVTVIAGAVYLLTTSQEPTDFDYFVRLADAFLHGRLYLLEAPSWLNELVPGGGGWYVVYPPVPAVLLLPFVAIFETTFPQNVASCLFAALTVGLAWLLLGRFALTVARRLMLTAVFGIGTVFWYVAEVGSAWYLGHVCAVLFSTAAVLLALDRRWPVVVGVLLGLAAVSRLPVALASPGVLLLMLGIGWPVRLPSDRMQAVRTTLAFGIGMAFPVGLYFLYNLARWGSLMDQGYTLIPGVLEDPIYAEHGIFAIEYIPRHIYAIFLQSWRYVDEAPFLQPDWRGLGLFLTTPLFLWLLRARLQDPRVLGSAVAIALVSIPIITHGNTGLAQFGYRFSLDVQVFLFVILATVFERGMSRLAWLAALASIVICAYGIWAISIDFISF